MHKNTCGHKKSNLGFFVVKNVEKYIGPFESSLGLNVIF